MKQDYSTSCTGIPIGKYHHFLFLCSVYVDPFGYSAQLIAANLFEDALVSNPVYVFYGRSQHKDSGLG